MPTPIRGTFSQASWVLELFLGFSTLYLVHILPMKVPTIFTDNSNDGAYESGEEGSTQTREMEKKSHYHELYLQQGSTDFITPIQFEDGMDWNECELYYASIADGATDLRSAAHLKRATQIRRKSKKQLRQHVDGQLESCLRRASKYAYISSRPPMRRAISFSTLPKCNVTYSQYLCDEMKETSNGPHVNFDDYVSVATIPLVEDYPEDVVEHLWLSTEELDECFRGAMREEALRRAKAKRRAMQAIRGQKKPPSPPQPALAAAALVLEEEKCVDPSSTATSTANTTVDIALISQ